MVHEARASEKTVATSRLTKRTTPIGEVEDWMVR
jgi:hypothetical protein